MSTSLPSFLDQNRERFLYELKQYLAIPSISTLPENEAALERALAAGRKNGVAIGYHCGTPEEVRQRIAQGFTFLCYATDYNLIVDAARVQLASVEHLFSG